MEAVSGKHSIDSVQKTAYTRNITHYRKYCSLKPEPPRGGDHCWFKRSTRKKRPVTRDNKIIIIIHKQADQKCIM
jgi:hypothetical protein